MKKLVIIAATALLLTSCGSTPTSTTSSPEATKDSSVTTEQENSDVESDGIVKAGDSVSVQYTGRLEDGTIFDSSRKEDAAKSKNYNPERKYDQPLVFTVGAGQMIPGFDKGVLGMKVGDKKTLTIAPKDAYGEATQVQTFPIASFQDVIKQDIPKSSFDEAITQNVPLEKLGEEGKTLEVGKTIVIGGVEAKVKSIENGVVKFEIENKQNPFYKKTLKVGLKGEFDGNVITIKKIGDESVSVEIINKQNPFYGKKLKKGLVGKLPDGQKITIKDLTKDEITVEVPNTHELAGKTLIFDIEVTDIKAGAKQSEEDKTLNLGDITK